MGRTAASGRGSPEVFYPHVAPMSAVRRFAREIVKRFHPDKIILFGSYACGTATPDSDVDLLVVMPTRNQIEQAVLIDEAISGRGFPLDLLVRTPKNVGEALRQGDAFLQEIMTQGKMLYEKVHAPMGAQSRKRSRRSPPSVQAKAAASR